MPSYFNGAFLHLEHPRYFLSYMRKALLKITIDIAAVTSIQAKNNKRVGLDEVWKSNTKRNYQFYQLQPFHAVE